MESHNPYSTPCRIELIFKGVSMSILNKLKLLGTVIDKHLRWSPQLDSICQKLIRCYYVLGHLHKFVGVLATISFYHSNVASVLNYNTSLLGGVNGIQKHSLGLIFGFSSQKSC
ncbi:hypothetical protein WA026_013323 [Henosepilachna vigintioctopunctata]|uniref:Uncharacterized protein n=1 Tax=Henosepilachna vigintioctopunctata TaxID=420089 RepID=A0AAW1VBH9_9CUCU